MDCIVTKKRTGIYLFLELRKINTLSVASKLLCIYPDWNRNVMILANIETVPEFQRQGFGSKLIRRAIWEARRNGCTQVRLDDCSDGFNSKHNIYLKNGFVYERIGLPEMIFKF